MRKKIFFLFILLLSNAIVFGKNDKNKTKTIKGNHKSNNKPNEKPKDGRTKRSLHNKADNAFVTDIGHEVIIENPSEDIVNYASTLDEGQLNLGAIGEFQKDQPFWGMRGRRSDPGEMYVNSNDVNSKYSVNTCKFCYKSHAKFLPNNKRDDMTPFWGSRGRRDSQEVEENNPFWGNRGRRQEDPPFWGNRGRRDKVAQNTFDINHQSSSIDDPPFWASRGRRDEMEPFWGTRGRRDDIEPFWGNRGRRDEVEPFWGDRGRRDDPEPFWGNRGRRDDSSPFWGNRGRRDEMEPFWGNRGRRDDNEPFWGNRGRRNDDVSFWAHRGRRQDAGPLWGNRARRETDTSFWEDRIRENEYNNYWTGKGIRSLRESRARKKIALKDSLINGMNYIKYDIEKLARIRRGDDIAFWSNRGRDSKLKYLFNDSSRNRASYIAPPDIEKPIATKLSVNAEPNTVHDDRIFAEEPRYILIERSSRSSAEDDPFFITRGKKYSRFKLPKGDRDRRGAIEELVKSVRNDPYYIARGKKDSEYVKIKNSTISEDESFKAKQLICSTVDLIVTKNDGHRVARDVDDTERERRTILKKLAAQLQIDPYFVSRGKKNVNDDKNEKVLEEFLNKVSEMC